LLIDFIESQPKLLWNLNRSREIWHELGSPGGGKSKRGTVRDDDSDRSYSDTDDELLIDHLVGDVANEDDAMCIICGHGDSEVR
jgi:hypothetical protein